MAIQKQDLPGKGSMVFRAARGVTIATQTLGLGVFFYLATFTRYVADDFCEVMQIRRGPLLSVIYESFTTGTHRSANRFSKLFFINLSEWLGPYQVRILPIVMILLWLIGLFWVIREIKKMIGMQQSMIVELFLAISIVFFSMVQAPNVFQIYYWRSSMLTHLAPVVLSVLLIGFVLFQVRSAKGNVPGFWVPLVVLLASFIIGGAGETPAVLMVAVYVLILLYFWMYRGPERRPALVLFSAAFAGMFLALLAMFLSPANLSHGETSFIELPLAVLDALKYTYEFIWDTFVTLPLPTLVSIILPVLFFFCLYIQPNQQPLLPTQKRQIGMALLLLPLLIYLLIAASFMPSAYAQYSYPVERVRFSGRFLMTLGIIIESALLGVWFAQLKQFLTYRHTLFPIAGVMLLVTGLYPLRSANTLWKQLDDYRGWAIAWDEREDKIYSMAESGVQDAAVEWFPNRFGVKDIDGSTEHWMNKCVADYYGFNTIRSIPMGE
jgi:hypothetical protein